jgi:hypothetical protein
MIQSRYEIAADRQNLRVRAFEFVNTSLVLGEFPRSTTGESGREERQDDVFLPLEIGKFDFFIVLIAKRKVGSGVADLKMRMLWRRLRKQGDGCEWEQEYGFHRSS